MTNKFESKCLRKFYVSSKQEKELMIQEDELLPRATEPPFLSALHSKNDTTNPSLAINLASQQKTTKFYFSSQVRKQFKLLNGSI